MVKRGERVAPIEKKNPVKTSQKSGLSCTNILRMTLIQRIVEGKKQKPETKSIKVKLIQLKLRLHRKIETEEIARYRMSSLVVETILMKYLTEMLPLMKATDLTINMKE